MNLQIVGAAAGIALVAAAGQACAHARLVTSTPAANAVVPAPQQLTLRFSETLLPAYSGLTVTMPQRNNMVAPVKVAVSNDRRGLVATPMRPLAAGVYRVSWHAMTADSHRVRDAYSFTVRGAEGERVTAH